MKVVNIIVNGHRTSVKLSNIQKSVAEELAGFRNMKLSNYLEMLVMAAKEVDEDYSKSMGIRDGIIMELYQILYTTLEKQNKSLKKVLN